MVRFQNATIVSHDRQAELSRCLSIIRFLRRRFIPMLWRILTIGCRVLAIAMFAACYAWYITVLCLMCHFIGMLIWIFNQPTQYFRNPDNKTNETRLNKWMEYLFRCLAAYVHIFTFFNLLSGHTRLRAIFYYAIVYSENLVLILLWNFHGQCTKLNSIPALVVLCVVVVGFWIGFMLIHYKCCHDKRSEIKLWVPCNEMYLCKEPTDREG